jgi:DNA repair protein RecN (Recombination protein N)
VVSKATRADGHTASTVVPVSGEARAVEVARMLGGERLADTRLAHARAMLQSTTTDRPTSVTSQTRRRSKP